MKKPKVIGITGGIGSGKSTLSDLLRGQGYPVYDTDMEARRLQNTDEALVHSTKELLGEEVYREGLLDRSKVAAMVFTDSVLLRQLTALVHPVVKHDFKEWLDKQTARSVFIESAVLFEGGFDALTDTVIVVTAPEELRIRRVMDRDGISRAQVMARIKNQLPEAEKLMKADIIITTDKGISTDVFSRITSLFKR
ncbi:MAG: dephospho-CoA kinase [Bacteroidales bacterium]|nr:dephospho-CoA kinase [Bacteroidales bacterium]OJX83777.1 MAG: dephospho-CoA kinase [Paludibacter sp. 47-17]